MIKKKIICKNSSKKSLDALEIMTNFSFKLGSCNITTYFEKGILKKKPIYGKDWMSNPTIKNDIFGSVANGYYVVTGETSNLLVLDLDDMEDEHCKKMYDMCTSKNCSLIVKTRKGYHYYFLYDCDFSSKMQGKNENGVIFDLQTNGQHIFCPPTTYNHHETGEEYKYEIQSCNKDFELLAMPKKLKKYIIDNFVDVVPKEKTKKKTAKKKNENKTDSDTSEEVKHNNDQLIANVNEDDIQNFESKMENHDYRDLLKIIKKDRSDTYDDWINVGQILKNQSTAKRTLLNEWIDWSKQSQKFKEGECEKKWDSFKKTTKGVKLGTLLMIAIKDNPEEYTKFKQQLTIKNVIQKNKDKFPENNLQIKNIVSNAEYHYVDLLDKYCPINKSNHNKESLYLELYNHGKMYMKCNKESCRGKIFPCEHSITLTKNEVFGIFGNNNTINMTMNMNVENNDNVDVDMILPNVKIFDDIEFNRLIIDSLNETHYDIARTFHYLYRTMYVCTNKKVWYEFKNHRWNEGEDIRRVLSEEFVEYYKKIKIFIRNESMIEKEKKLILLKISNIITNLKTESFKNYLFVSLCELYKDKDFEEKLDATPYLLGFENGIYDLKKFEFRAGKKEDYVSMSCGYNFSHEYTNEKHNVIKFFEDIQPHEKDREYLLTYLACCLSGINSTELFTIITGRSGRNGKSKMLELIYYALGDYVGRPKCKLLTGNRPDENNPEPGLLSLKKKRIIFVSEPEKGDQLNGGFIKFITGNDTMMLRRAHKNEMEKFKANFITMLICNGIPPIDNLDSALAKRLRLLNFVTEFTKNPQFDYQKLIDEHLQEKIPKWKNDFMLLLIEYYKKFVNTGLQPTENILAWTNQYKEDTDIFLTFLNNCTEPSDKHIGSTELYEYFKIWFRNENPSEKIINRNEFSAGIRKYKDIEKSVMVEQCDNNGNIHRQVTSGIKHLKIKQKDT